MTAAFAIEADGLGLGTAVHDGNLFRFHAAQGDLFKLEKFIFVSLRDVECAARRAHAANRATAATRRAAEVSRFTALNRWRGLPATH